MAESCNHLIAAPTIGVETLRLLASSIIERISSVAVNAAVADSKITELQLVARAAVLALADSAKLTARAIAEADASASVASEHAAACTGIVCTLEATLLHSVEKGQSELMTARIASAAATQHLTCATAYRKILDCTKTVCAAIQNYSEQVDFLLMSIDARCADLSASVSHAAAAKTCALEEELVAADAALECLLEEEEAGTIDTSAYTVGITDAPAPRKGARLCMRFGAPPLDPSEPCDLFLCPSDRHNLDGALAEDFEASQRRYAMAIKCGFYEEHRHALTLRRLSTLRCNVCASCILATPSHHCAPCAYTLCVVCLDRHRVTAAAATAALGRTAHGHPMHTYYFPISARNGGPPAQSDVRCNVCGAESTSMRFCAMCKYYECEPCIALTLAAFEAATMTLSIEAATLTWLRAQSTSCDVGCSSSARFESIGPITLASIRTCRAITVDALQIRAVRTLPWIVVGSPISFEVISPVEAVVQSLLVRLRVTAELVPAFQPYSPTGESERHNRGCAVVSDQSAAPTVCITPNSLGNGVLVRVTLPASHPSVLQSVLRICRVCMGGACLPLGRLGEGYTLVDHPRPGPIRAPSSLQHACRRDDIHEVRYLLAQPVESFSTEETVFEDQDAFLGYTCLSFAILYRDIELAMLLCKAGADLRAVDRHGATVLHLACRYGDVEAVRYLLSRPDAAFKTAAACGTEPLHAAAKSGNAAVVRLLLDEVRCDPNVRCSLVRATPLGYAVAHGHVDAVVTLLSDARVLIDPSVLYFAARHNCLAIARLLLVDPRLDMSSRICSHDSLVVAARSGHVEIVRALLGDSHVCVESTDLLEVTSAEVVDVLMYDYRIDVNSRNAKGQTPLLDAVAQRRCSVVEALLSHPSVDVNAQLPSGASPLYVAVACCPRESTGVLPLLLATPGIDLRAKCRNGLTPLIAAARRSRHDLVTLLLALPGIDPNAMSNSGQTPLYCAVAYCPPMSRGATPILLADPRVDFGTKCHNGLTPLIEAARRGRGDLVKLLLAQSAVDVNSQTVGGFSALHGAAYGGHADALCLLTEDPRINVNIETRRGVTPFLGAVARGRTVVVRILLANARVDVSRQAEGGRSALTIATNLGRDDIAASLRGDPRTC